MCVDLAQMLVYLGNPSLTPDQEGRLNVILDASCDIVKSRIWDWSKWTKEQLVRYCDIINCPWSWWLEFDLNIWNIESIDQINGITYTWTLGYDWDYVITDPKKRHVIMYDLVDYTDRAQFDVMTVTYTAWFDPLPNDIAYLQMLIAEYEFYKNKWQKLESYKLRERTVKFASATNVEDLKNMPTVNTILQKYRILDRFSIV